MVKAAKKVKKAARPGPVGFRPSPAGLRLAALLAAVWVFLALIFHPQGLGLLGSGVSGLLISSFGLGAFWPIPALFLDFWMSLKRIPLGLPLLFKVVGW
ncbi:MAG: hypothetical protein LBP55_01600, partial [Candidatus Adiutrix sp.]|nr:hypothetical protein [Candidatus Adiutrix sp.]